MSDPTTTKLEQFWKRCLDHWGLVLTFILLFIVIVILVTTLVHNRIHALKMWNREMFDEVLALAGLIIGGLFGIIGWFGSYVVERMQGRTLEAQTKVIAEVGLLEAVNKQLIDNITSLEEVIRCKIDGIPNILGRAIAIIEGAIDDVTLITFTPHLGAAHLPRFETDPDADVKIPRIEGTHEVVSFREGVRRFWTALFSSVQKTPRVKILSIPESRYHDFASRLKNRKDYERSGYEEDKAAAGLKKAWTRIIAAAESRDSDIKSNIRLNTTESLPYQLLIAQLKPRSEHGKERWGCMVFLVGSGNIDKEQAAVGFYTELYDFVEIFKAAANSSFDGSTPVFPEPAPALSTLPLPAVAAPDAVRQRPGTLRNPVQSNL